MKYKVLVSAPYLLPFIDRFRPFFHDNEVEIIIPIVEERLEEKDLLKYIPDIDGAICGDDQFTNTVLGKAKKLKVISKWGTGIDSIDQAACAKIGIAVRNVPNAFTIPVSDTVLAYILNFARNGSRMTDEIKSGRWCKIQGRALHECSLGVVGVGNIGETVLRKAKAFSMELYATDIHPIPGDLIVELDIKEVGLTELLAKSDFVSLNCDLNDSSYHLINSDTLNKMKKESILINTSRGPVVNEQDLIRALKDGRIGGAALDVFEREPLSRESELLTMSNVMLAPHNSNSSIFAWEHVHKASINNLMEGLGINNRI